MGGQRTDVGGVGVVGFGGEVRRCHGQELRRHLSMQWHGLGNNGESSVINSVSSNHPNPKTVQPCYEAQGDLTITPRNVGSLLQRDVKLSRRQQRMSHLSSPGNTPGDKSEGAGPECEVRW